MAKKIKKRSKFSGAFLLLRPLNTLFAIACVYVGLVFTGDFQPSWLLALVTVGLIFASGNAFNDALDSEIDKKAHPSRPIPLGTIPKKTALKIAIILTGLAISISLCAMFFGYITAGKIAIVAIALLLFYNIRLKKIPLLGNMTIGLLGGLTFIYSSSFGTLNSKHLFAACFAFLFHISREIVKDIADFEAEAALGVKTLPAVIGTRKSSLLASIILVSIFPLTLAGYFTQTFSLWYLGSVVLFADLPLLLFAWIIPQSLSTHRASKIASDLKWVMAGGLFALYLGGITG